MFIVPADVGRENADTVSCLCTMLVVCLLFCAFHVTLLYMLNVMYVCLSVSHIVMRFTADFIKTGSSKYHLSYVSSMM